ncbi:50S ribosomal protein L9 [Candidatus Albibeggiatoa sp. nov. NOAA]|uniref:50S ribosomal protein L9 n=1 Tax=Candidatus Albibeggiatoa sp. nov. NOAA TaxID=3162724 RepID=UPI0032F76CD3|nr:50S ribosomal protein L9 [Thiotrichaceae bacterium]
MEVILLEKIRHLGNLGDKVKVKPGYGRNYLIPHKKAVSATEQNLAAFEARRAELEKAQQASLDNAQTRAGKLQELTVIITGKVGMEGKLYGSVSAIDIAQAVSDAGIELAKHEVRMPHGPIRHIGDYNVDIHLHADVDTNLKVQVIAEAEEA